MNKLKNKISVIILLLVFSILISCGSIEPIPTKAPLQESPSPTTQIDSINLGDGNTITAEQNTEITAETYIGNKNSKKFHKPDCNTLPDEKNRVYFNSRDEAIGDGFTSCAKCRP